MGSATRVCSSYPSDPSHSQTSYQVLLDSHARHQEHFLLTVQVQISLPFLFTEQESIGPAQQPDFSRFWQSKNPLQLHVDSPNLHVKAGVPPPPPPPLPFAAVTSNIAAISSRVNPCACPHLATHAANDCSAAFQDDCVVAADLRTFAACSAVRFAALRQSATQNIAVACCWAASVRAASLGVPCGARLDRLDRADACSRRSHVRRTLVRPY